MNIYVGNLSHEMSDQTLDAAFAEYGTVDAVRIIMDRDTGRPKGFGFVEMAKDEEAKAAIEGMNGKDLKGRALNVNEARPREDRAGGGAKRDQRPPGGEGEAVAGQRGDHRIRRGCRPTVCVSRVESRFSSGEC